MNNEIFLAFLSAIGLIRKNFGLSECNRVNKGKFWPF